MLAQVISFGTGPGSYAARQDLRQRLMNIMKTTWYPSWKGPPGTLAEALTWTDENSVPFFQNLDRYKRYLSSDDLTWLENNSPVGSALNAPKDYEVKVCERVKHLERSDLLLGENDTDWHIPMLLTVREHAFRNWRKRSTEKAAARDEKRRKTPTGRAQDHSQSWSSDRAQGHSQSWPSGSAQGHSQSWSSWQSWYQC